MCGRVAELMQLFERVGGLYVGGIMKPAWASFEEDPTERAAIELFLRQYAYERLGHAPTTPGRRRKLSMAARTLPRTACGQPSSAWSVVASIRGQSAGARAT
jgi:hypothetical protein